MYKTRKKPSSSTLFWVNKVRNRTATHQVKQLPDHQINSQSAKLPEKEIKSKKLIQANTRPENQQVRKSDRLAIKSLPDHQTNNQLVKPPDKKIKSKQ